MKRYGHLSDNPVPSCPLEISLDQLAVKRNKVSNQRDAKNLYENPFAPHAAILSFLTSLKEVSSRSSVRES